jgi:hypothetical protein
MKFSIKKFNGDDRYSWAVFRASDVRGMRSPIFSGQASPVVSGLSRRDANFYKSNLESGTPEDELYYRHEKERRRKTDARLSDDERRLKEIDARLLELKSC